MRSKIIVGVDGSDHAQKAVEWCAAHAPALDAEVVVVYAIDAPTYVGAGPPYIWLKSPTPEQREAQRDLAARDWCKPLANAGVPFRVVVVDGEPAPALMEAARTEDAGLVVTGRRGHGGFKNLLLGSTGHHLSHHLDRPLVIVP
jgi:nucleotide-binding universal stress UspA family protein